jgi:hypothetical protein
MQTIQIQIILQGEKTDGINAKAEVEKLKSLFPNAKINVTITEKI